MNIKLPLSWVAIQIKHTLKIVKPLLILQLFGFVLSVLFPDEDKPIPLVTQCDE